VGHERGRACSTNGEEECIYEISGKVRKKEPLGRQRRRWVDYIKIDVRDIGWGGIDWIDLAQDSNQWRILLNTGLNLWSPYIFRKFFNSCTSSYFSRRAQVYQVNLVSVMTNL
jgi:hypothetical protein